MGVSAAEALPARAERSASAVALRDVTITFRLGKGLTYTAVSDATLSVADGEFVAIVGPTGCGKSTLLNVAAGLLAPSSGAADIFGEPLTGLNLQSGYLFQADSLFPGRPHCRTSPSASKRRACRRRKPAPARRRG